MRIYKKSGVDDRNYYYSVGDITEKGLLILKKIIITSETYTKRRGKIVDVTTKGYIVKCIKDGYEYETSEYNAKKYGCPVCQNRKIIKGINDIATVKPDLVKYFYDVNDAYNHSLYSGDRVLLRCPNCGEIKSMTIACFSTDGFSCPKCSDGISYPNKFMYSLLKQSSIEFETEKTFEWSSKKRYDVYIESLNCIIENNGKQHYCESTGVFDKLQIQQENDRVKKELALSNGIEHYIVLDCRYSELEYIKNSVMNSELPKLLNFKEEDIDWDECDRFYNFSMVKLACEYYNSKKYDTVEISKILKCSRVTLTKYLKRGTKLGLCNYDSEYEILKGRSNFDKSHVGTKVYVEGYDYIFESMSDLSRKSEELFGIRLPISSIYNSIINDTHCKGYIINKLTE